MRVWIAERGEKHEGGSIVGVFDSYDKACTAAMEEKAHFAGGWGQIDGTAADEFYRENGCDWVAVSVYEVE